MDRSIAYAFKCHNHAPCLRTYLLNGLAIRARVVMLCAFGRRLNLEVNLVCLTNSNDFAIKKLFQISPPVSTSPFRLVVEALTDSAVSNPNSVCRRLHGRELAYDLASHFAKLFDRPRPATAPPFGLAFDWKRIRNCQYRLRLSLIHRRFVVLGASWHVQNDRLEELVSLQDTCDCLLVSYKNALPNAANWPSSDASFIAANAPDSPMHAVAAPLGR